MFNKCLLLAGVLTVSAIAAPAARAEEVPAAVDRAYRAVQQDGAVVMKWAYPTVAFDQVGPCNWREADTTYTLTCRFDYKDSDGFGSRVLSFRLNGRGFIVAIEDGGGSSVWPPFATMGLATLTVAAVASDELDRETDPDKRALLKLLAEAPEPQKALAAIMNLKMLARS